MKEIIAAIVTLAILLGGGTAVLSGLHHVFRRAALTTAAQGLPSLERTATSLQKKSTKPLNE